MMKADVTLDTLGLRCPMPVILTTKKIKELEPGQVLEVLSDDQAIKKDMPAWCHSTGNECLEIHEENGSYRVFVKKRQA
jgi:tRNA 2-thiouridine synthesizing protein A